MDMRRYSQLTLSLSLVMGCAPAVRGVAIKSSLPPSLERGGAFSTKQGLPKEPTLGALARSTCSDSVVSVEDSDRHYFVGVSTRPWAVGRSMRG